MKSIKLLSIFASSLLLAGSAKALDFDFSGTFTKDNDVVSLFFDVGAPSTVTIFSSSWVTGGFDPVLAIWDSTGNRMYEQDDGNSIGSALSNGVSYNYGSWDSYYSLSLGAGTYRATIAQYDNFSVGTSFADGFAHDGDDNFTTAFGSQPYFNGVFNEPEQDTRTGNWVFHVLNVEGAHQEPPTNSVPDTASTLGLLGLGMMALAGVQRRVRRNA